MLVYRVQSDHYDIKWKHFPRYWLFCAGNSTVTGEFPSQRPVRRSFGFFFDLRLNKRVSKQSCEAGDLRRHRAHYDVIVMSYLLGLYNQIVKDLYDPFTHILQGCFTYCPSASEATLKEYGEMILNDVGKIEKSKVNKTRTIFFGTWICYVTETTQLTIICDQISIG